MSQMQEQKTQVKDLPNRKNRIVPCFDELRKAGQKAVIPFITAGYPDLKTSRDILMGLADMGADLIELGLPFSDPMADGPVIQKSSFMALEKGFKTDYLFDLVTDFRRQNNHTSIIVMGYYNTIYSYGTKTFMEKAAQAGIDGFIIVDLPMEEEDELLPELQKHDLELIRLIAPTSTGTRLDRMLSKATGFLYYIAIKGITGTHSGNTAQIHAESAKIREKTTLPIVAGFGIKTAEQAVQMAQGTDGVVVGSALIAVIDVAIDEGKDPAKAALDFVKNLAKAVKNG